MIGKMTECQTLLDEGKAIIGDARPPYITFNLPAALFYVAEKRILVSLNAILESIRCTLPTHPPVTPYPGYRTLKKAPPSDFHFI